MDYKRPSAAASVAVFAKEDNAFLVIRRRNEPYKDYYSFQGGFLDVGNEDLEHAAVRELEEEAGISVQAEDLHLIDVRSNPTRDPREHVIDVGFLLLIDRVRPIPPKTDEATPEWMPCHKLDSVRFAFDHDMICIGSISNTSFFII
jgi:8-oxo-dGTP diphosphatase